MCMEYVSVATFSFVLLLSLRRLKLLLLLLLLLSFLLSFSKSNPETGHSGPILKLNIFQVEEEDDEDLLCRIDDDVGDELCLGHANRKCERYSGEIRF